MQTRGEFKARLREFVRSADAWGTDTGTQAFARLNAKLQSLPDATRVTIDFGGINRTDVSFQREAIVETIRRHRPRLLFVADGLANVDVRANLAAALAQRGEALLLREPKGDLAIVGRTLSKEHEATLRAVRSAREFRSAMLTSKPYGLESSTASARLTWLWKTGLIERVQGSSPSGGREYKYFPIE